MLYENNRNKTSLDKSLFQNPTAEYRATPFWAWNCDLQKDELLRQIDVFREMGLGGFHIHCRAGMSTTYLSDSFMDLVKACTDHAKDNHMLSWLYDEDKWPSGYGGGYVTANVEFRKRQITFTCDPQFSHRDDALLLACFDVVLGEDLCLASYKRISEDAPAEGTRWFVWREIDAPTPRFNNQTYVDTLNKQAIRRFLEITHDRYFDTVGDEFGKTVPAIFTDEPQFSHKDTLAFADSRHNVALPWTDDLEDTYRETYGESLMDHLPELLWDLPDGRVSLTRYRYHDHVAERFAQAFSDTCGDWCRAHGIELTGHMMAEPTLRSQTSAIGDCMRSYRAFGIPGIDMLCAAFEFTTAKQCQSAVHQYGRPGMMSELYGVTGWDFDFRGHKLHGDWQAALGVTVRVPHLSWVSMKGTAKRDYPASISYQSSWYKEYRYVEDHFGRVNTALTRGKPLVKVAVIHPVESYWLHWGPNQQTQLVRDKMDEQFRNVTDWLLKGNIDFDFICESTLPAQCAAGGAPLQVGEMAYDVVVVPECETLRATTLERLEAFRDEGGKLVFIGNAPLYEDAQPSLRGQALFDRSRQVAFNRGAILDELYENRTVEIRDGNGALTTNLLHQIRLDENGRWLFISHCTEPYNKDVANDQHIRVCVQGLCRPELWDTVTGEIKPIPYTHQGGRTLMNLRLFDYDSALIFLEDTQEACPTEAPREPKLTAVECSIPEMVPYTLSEPNALLLDTPRYGIDGEPLAGPENILRIDAIFRRRLNFPGSRTQPWVVEAKPAEHTATLEFTVHSEIDYESPYLALENPELTDILWNGEAVASLPVGYYVDRSIQTVALPPLRAGDNILRVSYPFAERSDCEAMYLLGQFGVRVEGRRITVTNLPEKLGFSDLTYQGLPFYGGAVNYRLPLTLKEEQETVLRIPHYTAAVNTVEVDGEKKAVVAYPPYDADLGLLGAGNHTVTVTCYLTRRNCFGDVHNADEKLRWLGPNSWVTGDSSWTYEYRLRRTGVISTPILFKKN